jgi:hypothetical protein
MIISGEVLLAGEKIAALVLPNFETRHEEPAEPVDTVKPGKNAPRESVNPATVAEMPSWTSLSGSINPRKMDALSLVAGVVIVAAM